MALNFDPIWPWSNLDAAQTPASSGGFFGHSAFVLLAALLVVLPLMLVGLSVGSYLVGTKITWRRRCRLPCCASPRVCWCSPPFCGRR